MNCELCDKNEPLRAFELDSGWILIRFDCDPRSLWSFFWSRYPFSKNRKSLFNARPQTLKEACQCAPPSGTPARDQIASDLSCPAEYGPAFYCWRLSSDDKERRALNRHPPPPLFLARPSKGNEGYLRAPRRASAPGIKIWGIQRCIFSWQRESSASRSYALHNVLE
jgi:hypothetical protein